MGVMGLKFVIDRNIETKHVAQTAKKDARSIQCNLCHVAFKAPSSFHRFCQDCKQGNELYRFYDTLPEGAGAL